MVEWGPIEKRSQYINSVHWSHLVRSNLGGAQEQYPQKVVRKEMRRNVNKLIWSGTGWGFQKLL